ncbi:Glycosyltransferase family 92 [Dillenia turbinata]|uniref:Glycosyltransferase family 92 protein n=1 Tax=Dillenia turbinata TaxID=194707 RepID=A0AAN8Z848_9MAGN
MEAITGERFTSPEISIVETVNLPDQVLLFLYYPPSVPLFTQDDLHCVYLNSTDLTGLKLKLRPVAVDTESLTRQIVRCSTDPRGTIGSLLVKSNSQGDDDGGGRYLQVGPIQHRWDYLAYEALVDRDNTTIVFVKGFNLRSEKISDPSRFKCVYGWDFSKPKQLITSEALIAAQEIVRCNTPLSVLSGLHRQTDNHLLDSVKVSIRLKGRGTLHSVARPVVLPVVGPNRKRQHEMCVCTMLRNQAGFLREWVMYHGGVGVDRWFIYDNNSDDEIVDVVESLLSQNYNISRHLWPWVKTQEAGFAHCAMRARDTCEWVGFFDVDEFLHFPHELTMKDILEEQTSNIAELRALCYSFGPSGHKKVPATGSMVGYTCRLLAPERHKSIVRPEALNASLINVVHHFHLKQGYESILLNASIMSFNHYKYQVWEVFKQKFYRRVATFVADWQDEQNIGSKDRAPGLGTKPVEPPDWSDRFCEVRDTGLKDQVIRKYRDPQTGLLPWQEKQSEIENKVLAVR